MQKVALGTIGRARNPLYEGEPHEIREAQRQLPAKRTPSISPLRAQRYTVSGRTRR